MKVPITKPCFGDEERQAVLEPLDSGWVVQGPKVAEFERRFAEYAGAKHAIATTSCTSALHVAVVACGIKAGDEVLVPSFTWVSTANVVEMQGATPVFVDIDLSTYNVDVSQLEPALTARTKAIAPVSLFGLSADMQPILDLASRRRLKIIEDAACAIGATYDGHHAGTLADAGCFSFHPRKAITTGEGGMITTASDELAEAARCLRDHGASASDLVRHTGPKPYMLADFDVVGFNYRMTDLQGAVGVAQMGRLPWIMERRIRLARRYDDALAALDWLRIPAVPPGFGHGYQAYVCLFAPEQPSLDNLTVLHERRNKLMARLEEAGVATRPGTHAVHTLGYYRDKYEIPPERFPNSLIADRLSLTLPLYAQMTDEEQDYVVAQLKAAAS